MKPNARASEPGIRLIAVTWNPPMVEHARV